MKTFARALILVLVVALASAGGRWLWFYRGAYRAPEIPEIDAQRISPYAVAYAPAEDAPEPGGGRVVIDVAHRSNLAVNDLAPLRDRLEARGAAVEIYDGYDESMERALRRATAWVLLAPTEGYGSESLALLGDFVADGGRVLLATDPTRQVESSFDAFFEMPTEYPTVAAINTVANAFGIVYVDDYLYNLETNEGNYRNVRFNRFAEEQPLTAGLETVVLFAAHSLRGAGQPLVIGDAATQSPVRTGELDLAAAMLSEDGSVLALGDLTFLTAPYNTVADNDRFLSRIADWLATDGRIRDALEDFPFLFRRPVDIVQASGPALAPQLLAQIGRLRAYVGDAGPDFSLRAEAQEGRDALLVGTFDDREAFAALLEGAGVTFSNGGSADAEEDAEDGEPADDRLTVEGLGTLGLEGTTLFVLEVEEERTTLAVLAADIDGLVEAAERLLYEDLVGCERLGAVTVCTSGEAQELPSEDETTEEDEEEDTGQVRVLIIACDLATEGERTGVIELENALSTAFDVDVWSLAEGDTPAGADLDAYAAVILASGDYAFDFTPLVLAEAISQGVWLIGDQVTPSADNAYAPLSDLEVQDVEHPVLQGFEAGDVLDLSASESGLPSAVLKPEGQSGLYEVLLTRGSQSDEAGAPALVAVENEEDGQRILIGTFAFYRLPEEAQARLAINAIAWLIDAKG